MQRKTRSLLEELDEMYQERDRHHIVESRASNIIVGSCCGRATVQAANGHVNTAAATAAVPVVVADAVAAAASVPV